MKKLFILLIVLTANSKLGFSQIWKAYADSAAAYEKVDSTEQAANLYINAIEILRGDSSNTLTLASYLKALGALYYKMEQYARSEPFYLESKNINEQVLGKGHVSYANACIDLAEIKQYNNQYEEAEKIYIEALSIYEKNYGKQHIEYAYVCNLLGNFYSDIDPAKAEAFYLQTRSIRAAVLGKSNSKYIEILYNLGMFYSSTGKYELAEENYLEARNTSIKIGQKEKAFYADICNNLAILYTDIGKFDEAEKLSREAKSTRERVLGKEHPDYALSCHNLAYVLTEKNRLNEAELLHKEGKSIRERFFGKQHSSYAYSCELLGMLYHKKGDYLLAENLYLESKNVRAQVLSLNHPQYVNSIFNLALISHDLIKYDVAETYYLEAVAKMEKITGKDHLEYAMYLNSLGIFYRDMGQLDKAEQYLVEAKNTREKHTGSESLLYAQSCNNLAAIFSAKGKYDSSEKYYLINKEIIEKTYGKNHPEYASILYNLASIYHEIDSFDKAESLFVQAKKITGKEVKFYSSIIHNLGLLYLLTAKYSKAYPLLKESLLLTEKRVGKKHYEYTITCEILAQYYWQTGQKNKADSLYYVAFNNKIDWVDKVFEFTNEKEKEDFLNNQAGNSNKYASFFYKDFDHSRAGSLFNIELLARYKILTGRQNLKKDLFKKKDTTLLMEYNKWTALKESLAGMYIKNEDNGVLKKLEDSAALLEKSLSRKSSVFKQQLERPRWQDVQKQLQPGEALIIFSAFDYFNGREWTDSVLFDALVLTKKDIQPKLVYLFELKELDDLLTHTGNKTRSVNISNLYRSTVNEEILPSKNIYQLIWQPIEKHLKDVQKVYYIPANEFHRISFAALPINDTTVLSDKYQVVQLQSATSIENTPFTINSSDKIIMYGGINYNADTTELKKNAQHYTNTSTNARALSEEFTRGNIWENLDGTKKEIESIQKESSNRYFVKSVSGVDATEESFKALDGERSPDVLHIASHGFFFNDLGQSKEVLDKFDISGKSFKFSKNPLLRSGLLFAGANHAWQNKPISGIEDGILTALEISNMYLPNTKLVVLSACETALGDIGGSEGVYGLQRAFKMAGVENLIMSLWKVPDTETAEIMQELYKNLFKGQNIEDAFYAAQTFMKHKYRKDPYVWAGWILVR